MPIFTERKTISMKDVNSTSEEPILFFQYLLNYGVYDQLVNDFLKALEYSQPNSVDFIELSTIDYSPDENGVYDLRDTKFITPLSKTLYKEKLKSTILIDQKLRPEVGKEVNKIEVTNILNSLYALHAVAKNIINPGPKKEVLKSLINIILHIQNEYFFLNIKHPAFRFTDSLKNTKIEGSFFGCDDYKGVFFIELHDLLYRKGIIETSDDLSDSQLQFVEVMTSINPKETGSEIVFSIDNMRISYLIYLLQPLFTKFCNTTISQSESFKNERNKVLNSNDLDNSLSRFNEKNDPRTRSEIQSVFNEINLLKARFTNMNNNFLPQP